MRQKESKVRNASLNLIKENTSKDDINTHPIHKESMFTGTKTTHRDEKKSV